jgi:UDP-N-acetyl-D-mannosaminuronic acid dehydrogenase
VASDSSALELGVVLGRESPSDFVHKHPLVFDRSGVESEFRQTICVVGLGYIGLATSALLASRNFKVLGFDRNPEVVRAVNKGGHIDDPGLFDLVRKTRQTGHLKAFATPQRADAFVIAVPTPVHNERGHLPDLSYVFAAAQLIAPKLEPGNLVVLESTSPVGTTQSLVKCISGLRPDLKPAGNGAIDPDLFFAYCPERIIPGAMLKELASNDRIIGGVDERSAELAHAIYRTFGDIQCHLTDDRTAEMVKLVENSYRDVNIAFANEVSLLCRASGLDPFSVIELSNHHPRVNILRPGPGVGGHCIAVDPWFLVAQDPLNSKLIAAARNVNIRKAEVVAEDVFKIAQERPGRILLLGLTYKENVADFRESPALQIATTLSQKLNGRVVCSDPFIDTRTAESVFAGLELRPVESALSTAEIVVVLVPHREYQSLSFLPHQHIVDVVGAFRR